MPVTESQPDLSTIIISILRKSQHPLRAKDIVKRIQRETGISVDRPKINQLLYGKLKGKVQQNNNYAWCAVNINQPPRPTGPDGQYKSNDFHDKNRTTTSPNNHLIQSLFAYYLDCIREDSGEGASFFLNEQDKKFLIPPVQHEWNLCENSRLSIHLETHQYNFAKELRQRASTGALFYGYPLYVNWIERSQKGWSGGFAIPVFLQSLEYELNGSELRLHLIHEWPRINSIFLDKIAKTPEDRRDFLDQLGLLTLDEDPPEEGISDIVLRMKELGLPAEEIEQVNPEHLLFHPPISKLTKSGLYNRAIIAVGDRSKYTVGLEWELENLQQHLNSSTVVQTTALSLFLNNKEDNDRSQLPSDDMELIEVVPLNTEQRTAVLSAFREPLTVITGPPGTGKSQVVTTILANAYLKGQRVLFTSRNNKAVDVVETRLNGLSGYPLVIRTGRRSGERDLRKELLEFLTQILSVTVSEEDRKVFEETKPTLISLKQKYHQLWEELDKVVQVRNQVDTLDRKLDRYRESFPESLWQRLFSVTIRPLVGNPSELLSLLDNYRRPAVNFWENIGRWIRRRKDFKLIQDRVLVINDYGDILDFPPIVSINKNTLDTWYNYLQSVCDKLAAIKDIIAYKEGLQQLKQQVPLEKFSEFLAKLEELIWEASAQLIASQGKLLPDRIQRDMRRAFGEYRSTIERLSNDRLGGKVYVQLMREQEQLFQKISEILPTWCVTNLSARGTLPFEAGLFDLVVIDEASQCDIPSAIPLFYRAKRAVIIGDPNQLRHITTLSKQRDQQLQGKHGLNATSLQPFTFTNNSLFDLAVTRSNDLKVISLREHFRSHAQIIDFSNRFWYRNSLEIVTDYRRLAEIKNRGPGVLWSKISGKVEKPRGGGAVNDREARAAVGALKQLLVEREFKGTVGIVSPFRAQVNRIKDYVNQHIDLHFIERASLIVDTAHGFQGDERDVIIFSPCISREMPRGAKYFLSNTGNLFNVAITRARALLHIVGDYDAALQCGIKHIEAFAAYVGNLKHVKPNDISKRPEFFNPSVGYWEEPFYNALVKAGLKPMPQYQVNQYKLDFAIIVGNLQLDIEVDGEYYHKEWDGSRARNDIIRDIRLTALGWKIKRFWVYRVRDEMEQCVREVLEIVEQYKIQ